MSRGKIGSDFRHLWQKKIKKRLNDSSFRRCDFKDSISSSEASRDKHLRFFVSPPERPKIRNFSMFS